MINKLILKYDKIKRESIIERDAWGAGKDEFNRGLCVGKILTSYKILIDLVALKKRVKKIQDKFQDKYEVDN